MQSKRTQILSTKILEHAVVANAQAHLIDIVCLPFIESTPIINDELTNQITSLANEPANAIFTSSKSVAAVASILQHQPRWSIYCLFGATKQNVKKYFPEAVIHANAKDSAALAGQVMEDGLKEVHFFCGDKRMDTIPEKLGTTGVTLHQHIVYTTRATPHKVTKQYDGILFFSPSAVESFFSLNKIDEVTKCFAVGNTTAKSLKPYTNNIIVADTASEDAMLSKITEWYSLKKD